MPAIIFTTHALTRLRERYFQKSMVELAIRAPDTVTAGKQRSTKEYVKMIKGKKITAIVGSSRTGEKLVLSCWIDPPNLRVQKVGFWGKVWIRILGLLRVDSRRL